MQICYFRTYIGVLVLVGRVSGLAVSWLVGGLVALVLSSNGDGDDGQENDSDL